MRQWRLLITQPAKGAWNMAVDELILESVCRGVAPPTLRLYDWSPPCLSLGYAQTVSEVDLHCLHENGWDIVRRPTGGRAILHADELTYSVVLPVDNELAAGSIVDSYRRLSRALVVAMESLGAQVTAERQEEIHASGAICFETPSHYELTVGGRKLIGSAQMRRSGGLLQHGSLPLRGKLSRVVDALWFQEDAQRDMAREQVFARAITLSEALGGREVTWNQVSAALITGFQNTFDLELVEAELTPQEVERANVLMHTVYLDDAHTFKR